MLSKKVLALLALGVVLTGVAARAEELDDRDYIDIRKHKYGELGAAFKAINDQLKAPKPNLVVIRANVRTITEMASAQYRWFRPGSGPESEEKTAALPAIWKEPAKFKAAQDAFALQAKSFAGVAAGADVDAIRASAKSLGGACAACHKQFRDNDK